MKRSVIYIGASLIIAAVILSFSEGKLSSSFNKKNLAKAEYQTGDIIFQSSKLDKVTLFNWLQGQNTHMLG